MDIEIEYATCNLCHNSLIPKKALVRHQKYCKEFLKKCDICQQVVDEQFQEQHFNENHRKFPCKFCQQQFIVKELKHHMDELCESKPKICHYCELEVLGQNFNDHNKNCGARTIYCLHCQRYIKVKDYEAHQKRHENWVEEEKTDIQIPKLALKYEGIEDSLDNLSFKETPLASQSNYFYGLPIIQFQQDILKRIDLVAQKFKLSFGRAVVLLHASSWSRNNEKIVKTYSKIADQLTLKDPKELKYAQNCTECPICMDDITEENLFQLSCQHIACIECYQKYIKQFIIDSGQYIIFKTCIFDGCNEVLDFKGFVILGAKQYQKYLQFLTNDVLNNTSSLISCPKPNCTYLLQTYEPDGDLKTQQRNICCQCQHFFCNLCRNEGHLPADCQTLEKWKTVISSDNGEKMNNKWILSNTKPCPNCHTIIEKNEGCKHMKCRSCQYDYCWDCMKPFNMGTNHQSWYECNNAKPTQTELYHDLSVAEWGKQGYYQFGYLNFLKQAEFSRRDKNIRLKQFILFEERVSKIINNYKSYYKFFSYVNDLIIESRTALAYATATEYFIEDSDKFNCSQYLIGNLLRNLDRIDNQILVDFVEIDTNFIRKNGQTWELTRQFADFKTLLEDNTSKLKKFFKKLLLGFEQEFQEIQNKSGLNQQLSGGLFLMKQESFKYRSKQEINQFYDSDCYFCQDQGIKKKATHDNGLCDICYKTNLSNIQKQYK